ncbi:MAG TPA: hypothetical protein VMW58_07220 [Anaerolineae bacterium]|nr:hypothetical protein [Anaerolineae bacterium]
MNLAPHTRAPPEVAGVDQDKVRIVVSLNMAEGVEWLGIVYLYTALGEQAFGLLVNGLAHRLLLLF